MVYQPSSEETAVFGKLADKYLPFARQVLDDVELQKYHFMDNKKFQELYSSHRRIAETNQIYWTEILHRAHLAAVTSIARNLAWIEGVLLAARSSNYLLFASSLRALIEAIGDSAEVLVPVARYLAESNHLIKSCLRGTLQKSLVSKEVEDLLIHYSHARHVDKGEGAPSAHKAKWTFEYVGVLADKAEIPKIRNLYKELCNLVHPAAGSVLSWFEGTQDLDTGDIVWRFSTDQRKFHINSIVDDYGETLPYLMFMAFDPALLTLRVLHRFEIFPKLPELRKFEVHFVTLSNRIDAALKG